MENRGKRAGTKDYVRNYKRIMQNKPNFQDARMNVSILLQMDYENKRNWTLGQNKPNSKPIQTQSNPVLSAVEWANLETTPGGSPGIICLIWAS